MQIHYLQESGDAPAAALPMAEAAFLMPTSPDIAVAFLSVLGFAPHESVASSPPVLRV
jgi:hypothetical protein